MRMEYLFGLSILQAKLNKMTGVAMYAGIGIQKVEQLVGGVGRIKKIKTTWSR
jgi:hypothetical protein